MVSLQELGKVQCVHPYVTKLGDVVPCGNCVMCKIAHAAEWSLRLLHELEVCKGVGAFVTLTYSDNCLSPLNKRDLQLFIKMLRRYSEDRFKYYACGEYGGQTKRPHYHLILLGVIPTKEVMDVCWKRGFYQIGSVTYDSCRYVAQYVDKKFDSKRNKEVYGDFQPPFQLQSQGIGLRWLLNNADQLRKDLEIRKGRRSRGLSRYYKDKLQLTEDQIQELHDRSERKSEKKLFQTIGNYKETPVSKEELSLEQALQREKNALAKINLRRGKV